MARTSAARSFANAREFINETEARDFDKSRNSREFRKLRLARIDDKTAALLDALTTDISRSN